MPHKSAGLLVYRKMRGSLLLLRQVTTVKKRKDCVRAVTNGR